MSVSSEFIQLQSAVAGRYSLDRELGRGGMGIVFLARDVALDRPVAIKLLPPALAAAPAARARFLREARAAARLSHPHIVPVHAVEEHGDLVLFVMGFVDGETLGARVRRLGPLAPAEVARVVQEVAWALAHAHAHGVVHRDVKPDNILLEREGGRALVTDFGIAQLEDVHRTPTGGHALGTPHYMSPEQAAGEPGDARSDLYALGVTAFFAATGRHPFQGESAAALLVQHATTPAPPLLAVRPSLPPRLAAAVDRCLVKDPAARWPSADALAVALRDARTALPEIPPSVRRWLREADAAGSEIGTALTASGVSIALAIGTDLVPNDLFFGFIPVLIYWSTAALAAGLAKVRLAQFVASTRSLVRRGYGHAAARPALALDERARREEEVEEGTGEASAGRPSSGTALVAAGGAAGTALAVWAVHTPNLGMFLDFAAVAGSVALPTVTLCRLWHDLRGGRGTWHRLLEGRVGRAIFRVAATGQSAVRPALPIGGEPTVAVLGRAAEELFAALPAEQRARFAEVPALVGRLQQDAERLRAHAHDPAAAERLALTVAAIEALRLDLLKLHAGAGSLDELTRDVEAAREIGARVDAELAGRREVRAMLGGEVVTPV